MAANLLYFLIRTRYPPAWTQFGVHMFAWGLPLSLTIYCVTLDKLSGTEPASTQCNYLGDG